MPNLITKTVADGRFTILVRALTAAGMLDALSGSGPFTLFAPTDMAFGRLPDGQIDAWLRDDARPWLTSLMTYHTVTGRVVPTDRQVGTSLQTTIQGQWLRIALVHDRIRINEAELLETIVASNGLIHAIDTVLMPAGADERPFVGKRPEETRQTPIPVRP